MHRPLARSVPEMRRFPGPDDVDKFSNLEESERIRFINRQRPVKSWSQKLPDEGDFQYHTVELAVPVLDIGHYIIVVADAKKIKSGKSRAEFITTVS